MIPRASWRRCTQLMPNGSEAQDQLPLHQARRSAGARAGVPASGCNREGFRVPARRERSTRYKRPASEGLRTNARKSGERLADSGEFGGSGCAFALLQKRLSRLVPAAAQSRKSAGVSLAASRRSDLFRHPKKPIQSGPRIGRQRCNRTLFACGNSLVQHCPDFLASDVARPAAPGGAHFVCICRKDFAFEGVEQRRQLG